MDISMKILELTNNPKIGPIEYLDTLIYALSVEDHFIRDFVCGAFASKVYFCEELEWSSVVTKLTDSSGGPSAEYILNVARVARLCKQDTVDQKRLYDSIIWLISNNPADPFLSHPFCSEVTGAYADLLAAKWELLSSQNENNVFILKNAVEFFMLHKPQNAAKLILRCSELSPNDLAWKDLQAELDGIQNILNGTQCDEDGED